MGDEGAPRPSPSPGMVTRTTEPTTAIPAVELQLMRKTWKAMPYPDGNALRLLDYTEALITERDALKEVLRERAEAAHTTSAALGGIMHRGDAFEGCLASSCIAARALLAQHGKNEEAG